MAMRWRRPVAAAAFLTAALLSLWSAGYAQNGQNSDSFKARLSPVPISIAMMSTIAGTGSLTATLTGKQLRIEGAFEGLRSPATTAQIHRAPKGIPGPAISNLELTVTKGVKGSIGGTLELTPGSDCRLAERPLICPDPIRARARRKFVGLAVALKRGTGPLACVKIVEHRAVSRSVLNSFQYFRSDSALASGACDSQKLTAESGCPV